MRNFKPFRRILIIACVIYQMLFSMIGGGVIVYGSFRRLTAESEPSFFVSCLDLMLFAFVLGFPIVWGCAALMAFDERQKQPQPERKTSKQGMDGKRRVARLAWPQIIKIEEIEHDSDESET